ncbi:hypothetical protein [Arundinibacter roseus]|uniref:Outer membrane protein beta-barrel domain-containing protein n=1 Tax=Arundinibacter roseus TaxID=2070510 RepID=A0A4R4KI01_9BACT|nr:hypothetical protein [Arundinibacter roseus]TDB67473.1 hypothetical protein EZE20_05870 [Arundinibacter roseus]
MKTTIKYFFIVTFCVCNLKVSIAQTVTEPKTVFGNTKSLNASNIGFFVSPGYAFTQMDGSHASLFHLRGGVSFNDKFSFGGFYNTSMNQINPVSETLPNIYMDYWSAGGFGEFTLLSNRLLHLTLPLYVGFGEVQMDDDNGEAGLGESNFFKLEPSALLEVNLHKNVRFNIGAGYRYVGQMNYRNFDQTDLSGLTGYVGLKFGLFR